MEYRHILTKGGFIINVTVIQQKMLTPSLRGSVVMQFTFEAGEIAPDWETGAQTGVSFGLGQVFLFFRYQLICL